MSAVIFSLILLEFVFKLCVEIREVRSGSKVDFFAFFRCIPVLSDIFPSETNLNLRKTFSGSFARAHETSHKELHHAALCVVFKIVAVFFVLILLVLVMGTMNLNWIELLLFFHLILAFLRLAFHFLCFIEEYEADAFAVKKVGRAVALRALNALVVAEFPRTALFAFVYRTHPTAVMRIHRIK